jgi:hypothetical protein
MCLVCSNIVFYCTASVLCVCVCVYVRVHGVLMHESSDRHAELPWYVCVE